MADDSVQLSILISANNAASGVFKKVAEDALGMSPAMASVALGATAAIIGIGVHSVQMAAQYQQSMNMVQALTGASQQQMQQYSQQLLDMAPQLGVAPNELAKGLYYVMSAGYQGADAINVLKLASEDAVIGMTDQTTTANALTTVLKGFSVPIRDANRVNGELLETVTLGKMTMTDYAGAVGKAASTSMQYHVSMEDMNASIATMTSNGIPSARQAVTDYNQTLKVMYGNIGTVAASLKKNGIAFDETKFNAMSYSDKIQYMNQVLQEANDKHVKITGVTLQAAQAIQIISQHSQEFTKDLQTLSDKQAMGQKTADAWKITQGGFNEKMHEAGAALDVVFIEIGQQLLPVLSDLLSKYIIPLIQHFGDWVTHSGFVKDATHELVVIISEAATALEDIFGWFDKNQWALDLIKAGAIGFGVALAGIKVMEFASGLQNMFNKLSDGNGIMSNVADKLLSKFLPNTKAAFFDKGGLKDGIDQSKQSMEDLETQTDTTEAEVSAKSVLMDTELSNVETAAADVAGEEGIGTIEPAVTEAEGTVNAETALMESDLEGVGTAATTASEEEGIGAIGPAITTEAAVVETESSAMSLAIGGITAGVGLLVLAIPGISAAFNEVSADIQGKTTDINGQIETIAKGIQGVQQQFGKIGDDSQAAYQEWASGMWENTHPGQTPEINAPTHAQGGKRKLPSFASGVENFGGGLAFVHAGELLVNMSAGTSVIPAGSFGALGGNGQGPIFNLTVNAGMGADGYSIASVIKRELASFIRSNAIMPNISSGGRL